MPKKAYLANHFSSDGLKNKYRTCQETVEARRWHLLWKISLGWTIKNAALAVGLNYQYAFKILKKYNELGEEGVRNGKKTSSSHRRGKKPLLNEKQFQELIIQLKTRSPDGGIWTGPKVARWIEQVTGLEKVGKQRGWDYLKKCKYSWQKPRPKQWLTLVYQSFAKDVGLNEDKIILLVEDNAGWHRSEKVQVPNGIIVDFLPPYSPELQPAERLWSLVDEPLVNEYFETIEEIEEVLVTRCQVLSTMTSTIQNLTNYHWLTYG